MLDELIRRILIFIPQVLLILFVIFLIIDLTSGDIFGKYRLDPKISQTVKQIEAKFHFDKSIVVQCR